jgi:type IV secretory pathway TraG/TraD family ATPase VirD4
MRRAGCLLRNKPQPRDILRMMAAPECIEAAVKGTPLAALLDPGAPAQRAGVLSSLNMVADSLELLPEWEHTRKTFATAEWYTERKRWVFLTSSAAYRQKVLSLHSAWLDLFILRMMGYCEDQAAKPVWFVIDELASLNKLPQLHTAVTENRKYGNPVVMGLQGRSQIEKRYGQDAEAMLSQPATKIFLKTSEPRAAKWISEAIGEIEVERLKESRSMGLLRSKKSFSMEIATKPLIMASEIAGLAPLTGFIKLENHVVPARFRLAKKQNKQPEFLERGREQPLPRKVETVKISTPVKTPETKKPVQASLPLEAAPVAKKEGFSWDESKGIE